MKHLALIIVIVGFFSLSGCKSSGYILLPSQEQPVTYSNGTPFVSGASSEGIQVTVAPLEEIQDNRIILLIAVNNLSNVSITLSPDNFSASTDKGAGKILTYKQLKTEIHNEVLAQSFAAKLNRQSAQNNRYLYVPPYANDSKNIGQNRRDYTHVRVEKTPDQLAREDFRAEQRYEREIAKIQDFKQTELISIESVLKKETLLPNQNILFTLVVELIDPVPPETIQFSIKPFSEAINFKFSVVDPE